MKQQALDGITKKKNLQKPMLAHCKNIHTYTRWYYEEKKATTAYAGALVTKFTTYHRGDGRDPARSGRCCGRRPGTATAP
jgi:hypothetical protein